MSKQQATVLRHIKEFGGISSMEAFMDYGITRLSAVIYELRHNHGLKIGAHKVKHITRFGNTIYYHDYFLIQEES